MASLYSGQTGQGGEPFATPAVTSTSHGTLSLPSHQTSPDDFKVVVTSAGVNISTSMGPPSTAVDSMAHPVHSVYKATSSLPPSTDAAFMEPPGSVPVSEPTPVSIEFSTAGSWRKSQSSQVSDPVQKSVPAVDREPSKEGDCKYADSTTVILSLLMPVHGCEQGERRRLTQRYFMA